MNRHFIWIDHPLQTLKTALASIVSFWGSFSPRRQLWSCKGSSSKCQTDTECRWFESVSTQTPPRTRWGPLSELEYVMAVASELQQPASGLLQHSTFLPAFLSIVCEIILFCLHFYPLLQLSFIRVQNFPPEPYFAASAYCAINLQHSPTFAESLSL